MGKCYYNIVVCKIINLLLNNIYLHEREMKKRQVMALLVASALILSGKSMTVFAEDVQPITDNVQNYDDSSQLDIQNVEQIQSGDETQNSIESIEIKNDETGINEIYHQLPYYRLYSAVETIVRNGSLKFHYADGTESEWRYSWQVLTDGVELKIRDSSGKLVKQEYGNDGSSKLLSAGSYQVDLVYNNEEYKLLGFEVKSVEDCASQTLSLNNKVDVKRNYGNVTKVTISDKAVYEFQSDKSNTYFLHVVKADGITENLMVFNAGQSECYLKKGTYYIYADGNVQGLSMKQKIIQNISLIERPDGVQNIYTEKEFKEINGLFWTWDSKINNALKFRVTYKDGTYEDMNYEQFGALNNYDGNLQGGRNISIGNTDGDIGVYYEKIMFAGEGYTWENPIATIPFYVTYEFPDVPVERWDYPYIAKISAAAIMKGMDDGEFKAGETLVRAQFATTLYRMSGSPDVEYSTKFPDVADGQFYTKPILWASKVGVANGYANGNFGPGDNINREQMATMMYNYAKNEGYDISSKKSLEQFSDGQYVSTYAKNAMEWAVANGIITGKDSGTRLDPQGLANRGECAAILLRFLEKYVY